MFNRHHPQPPSYRNLQIYHELAYHNRSQTAVAPRYRVSQVRVSQIARQVQAWVDRILPARYAPGRPGFRFHLAIAHERIRLLEAHEPVLGMLTGPDGKERFVRRRMTMVDGHPMRTIEVSQTPSASLLSQALDVTEHLAVLEAIANLGPFADLPREYLETSLLEELAVSPDASLRPSEPSNATENTSKPPSNDARNQRRGVLDAEPITAPKTDADLCAATTCVIVATPQCVPQTGCEFLLEGVP